MTKLRKSNGLCQTSAAASGWAGWALAHLEFGSSVNPITTRGADCAHHITASPPGFEIQAASLFIAKVHLDFAKTQSKMNAKSNPKTSDHTSVGLKYLNFRLGIETLVQLNNSSKSGQSV